MLTRAPGRHCPTRSTHWSFRKLLCTSTSVFSFTRDARYSAAVVLPNPTGRHSSAPPAHSRQLFSTARTASCCLSSARSEPLNSSAAAGAAGARRSAHAGANGASFSRAQCSGNTNLSSRSRNTLNFLGKGSLRLIGATCRSRWSPYH